MRRAFLPATVMFLFPVAQAIAGKAPTVRNVDVFCAKGDSINQALTQAADILTVTVHGMCTEDVVISRNFVTLTGNDPAVDGVIGANLNLGGGPPSGANGGTPGDAVVAIVSVRTCKLQNLTIKGGIRVGIGVRDSVLVSVKNLSVTDNARAGLAATGSATAVAISDSVFARDGLIGVFGSGASDVQCDNCTISDTRNGLVAEGGGGLEASNSSISASIRGVLAGQSIVTLSACTISAPTALEADDNGQISSNNCSATGDMSSLSGGRIAIDGGSVAGNSCVFDQGSNLWIGDSAAITGSVALSAFSNMVLVSGGTIAGDLSCGSGSNAFCADPGNVSGSVAGCALCVKP